jgi:phosphatidylglycerol:prolipoprotein diacylglycerol transferase
MIEIGISPVAFSIGPITVVWYGITILLAVLVLVMWMIREVRRGTRLTYDNVITAAVIAIPSGLVVSRLLHVIDRWGYFSQHPAEIIGGSGLTIYGAILGGALGVWVYSRFSNFGYGYFVDRLAPAIVLAQAIGRLGCTVNGCCYGSPTALPWGIVYTNPESLGYTASSALAAGIGLHPTQVYEVLYNLVLFVVLLRLRDRLKPAGSLFQVYLGLYALWRLAVAFLRPGTPFLFGLNEAQVISVLVLFIVMPLLVFRTRWVKREEY